jgi:hypothetical protein
MRHLSGAVLALLLKIIQRKITGISNRNYEFFGFEYATSFYDIQVNKPKHPVLTFILAKIGTCILMN